MCGYSSSAFIGISIQRFKISKGSKRVVFLQGFHFRDGIGNLNSNGNIHFIPFKAIFSCLWNRKLFWYIIRIAQMTLICYATIYSNTYFSFDCCRSFLCRRWRQFYLHYRTGANSGNILNYLYYLNHKWILSIRIH